MAVPEKSTLTFNLVIDEDRCHILQGLFNAVELGVSPGDFFRHLGKHTLLECYDGLTTDVEKKQHERGWCKDPDCEFNKPKE